MQLVLGIDEAGYGPSLGPLLVCGALFRVPGEWNRADWWDRLSACICRQRRRDDWRFIVNDSKQAYDRKSGLHTLERTVLAFLDGCGVAPTTVRELLAAVAPQWTQPDDFPWYRELDVSLPADARNSSAPGARERLRRELTDASVGCVALMCELVTEDLFNRRVAVTHNKAAVLHEQVLRLIARAARHAPELPLVVRVDRLGGRADYRGMLAIAFPERSLTIVEVSEERSRYRLEGGASPWHIEFAVGADEHHLPVALASMVAKYVRELLMERFNAWWRRQVPDIAPTAGYYSDAQRFLAEIGPVLPSLGLSADRFVRAR